MGIAKFEQFLGKTTGCRFPSKSATPSLASLYNLKDVFSIISRDHCLLSHCDRINYSVHCDENLKEIRMKQQLKGDLNETT